MTEEHSITRFIADLKDGDEAAANVIWGRFFYRVRGLASKKLGAARKRIADEDDVALSAINALCTGAREGRFRQLENRDDLWQLLCMITTRKAALHWRKQRSKDEMGESIMGTDNDGRRLGFDQVISGAPTEGFMDALTATGRELLEGLDEKLREVAMLKLQGYTNKEIAERLERSVKSIDRYLATIRQHWEPAERE